MWLEVNKLLLPIAESQRQYVVSDIIHVCNSQHKSHFKGSSFPICSPRYAFSHNESMAFSLRFIHSLTLAITFTGAYPSTTLSITLILCIVWDDEYMMFCVFRCGARSVYATLILLLSFYKSFCRSSFRLVVGIDLPGRIYISLLPNKPHIVALFDCLVRVLAFFRSNRLAT